MFVLEPRNPATPQTQATAPPSPKEIAPPLQTQATGAAFFWAEGGGTTVNPRWSLWTYFIHPLWYVVPIGCPLVAE